MRETLSLNMNRATGALLIAAVAGLGTVRCGQALLTAPRGSLLRMEANPTFIEAHGGVSVISVAVIEPAGTVVPDGTVVQFFTTLGRIDEQGKTNDGVARVNLVATGLSGNANVTAVSGGEAAPPPSSTTSPTSTTPGSTTPGPTVAPTTTRPPGPTLPGGPRFGFAEGEGSATLTIAIGSARPRRVTVTASSAVVTASRPVEITAFVVDEFGNPVVNVPVFFQLRVPTATERLDSGGDPRFTDFNGVATDILRTTLVSTSRSAVTVNATTANGITGSAVVAVN
jgi:hypothetical protein